jgi:hypothetical protein
MYHGVDNAAFNSVDSSSQGLGRFTQDWCGCTGNLWGTVLKYNRNIDPHRVFDLFSFSNSNPIFITTNGMQNYCYGVSVLRTRIKNDNTNPGFTIHPNPSSDYIIVENITTGS